MPGETYSYSTAPHAIKPSKKYRDEPSTGGLLNDPRVVRGNTHALTKKLTSALQANLNTQSFKPTTSKHKEYTQIDDINRSTQPTYRYDPKPFVGRDVDISQYLVDKSESIKTLTKDVGGQCDIFQPRPKTPEYPGGLKPVRKTGIDKSTQVEDVRELFDFDAEVEPILSVIVQKTLEQALFEVQSEEDVLALEVEGERLRMVQAQDLSDLFFREQEVIQDRLQKEKILRDREAQYELAKQSRTLVAGLQFMRQIFPDMFEAISTQLHESRDWIDPIRMASEKDLMDVAVTRAEKLVSAHDSASQTLDELLSASLSLYEKRPPRPTKPLQSIQIIVDAPPTEGEGAGADEEGEAGGGGVSKVRVQVGSFPLSPSDSLESLESRVRDAARTKGLSPDLTSDLSPLSLAIQNLLGRPVARDGRLKYFLELLPSKIHVHL